VPISCSGANTNPHQKLEEKNMRKAHDPQIKLDQVSIEDITFDLRDRDEIPQVLIGLQATYKSIVTRNQIFDILWKLFPDSTNFNNGRPGMDLWEILVLGTLRLACDWDFDKIRNIANKHVDVRCMLGFADDDRKPYGLQTIIDNLSLFTPKINDQINQIVVNYGRTVAGSQQGDIRAACDSTVVKTDVHFPTDINILLDAIRCTLHSLHAICPGLGIGGWREADSHISKFSAAYLKITRLQKSKAKDPEKVAKQEQKILDAYTEYLDMATSYVQRAKCSLLELSYLDTDISAIGRRYQIEQYIAHAERQIDQIRRRKFQGEKIPHSEKVFSIFEPHTNWIIKGKAGVPFELGLNVCVVRDQNGFILYHKVMEKVTDKDVAVEMFDATFDRFGPMASFSCDQGFYNPANYEALKGRVPVLVMPRGGRLTQEQQERQNRPEHKVVRRSHAIVESSIHALKNHGLDRCPDHGLDGFKRYVSLSVLARNLQILGRLLQKKELKQLERQTKKAALAEA
jgi:transposase, IS5 family